MISYFQNKKLKCKGYSDIHRFTFAPQKYDVCQDSDQTTLNFSQTYTVSFQDHALYTGTQHTFEQKSRNVLHIAAENGNLSLFKTYLDSKVSPYAATTITIKETDPIPGSRKKRHDQIIFENILPYHIALQYQRLEIIQYLQAHGFDMTASILIKYKKERHVLTPLHILAEYGRIDLLEQILPAFTKVDVPGIFNMTPLHVAILHQCEEVALMLLNHGANPALTVQAGPHRSMNALHLACLMDLPNVIFEIIKHNQININTPSLNNVSAFHLACLVTRHPEVIENLVKAGIHLETLTESPPLHPTHLGMMNKNRNIFEIILGYYPQTNVQMIAKDLVMLNPELDFKPSPMTKKPRFKGL